MKQTKSCSYVKWRSKYFIYVISFFILLLLLSYFFANRLKKIKEYIRFYRFSKRQELLKRCSAQGRCQVLIVCSFCICCFLVYYRFRLIFFYRNLNLPVEKYAIRAFKTPHMHLPILYFGRTARFSSGLVDIFFLGEGSIPFKYLESVF